MNTQVAQYDQNKMIQHLKHFLPAQAPLKDFIHHNTLHAFQNKKFYPAIRTASAVFGYKVSLSIDEYRELYKKGAINVEVLERIIKQSKGADLLTEWKNKLLTGNYELSLTPRIGLLRANWKREFLIDLDLVTHPILFRILCSYLDQGISIWNFPVWHMGFLASIREIEKNTFNSFFESKRVKNILLDTDIKINDLLEILVGDASLYEQYLFDQQFTHQGWSGIVSTIEDFPETLLDQRKISLEDLIKFELLLEIDALDNKFGEGWLPLVSRLKSRPIELFANVPESELSEVYTIWQDAYEWSYYDQVLAGIKMEVNNKTKIENRSFQAMFCIDDREISFRRYLEEFDPSCETFSTPGFFSVEFFFQPEHGKFYTKQCPAPVTPKFLIKELGTTEKRKTDVHFAKHTHSLFSGWIISQTLGFWSALRLFINIFRPSLSPATAYSFQHMDKLSNLTIQNNDVKDRENDLQVGFTIEEMTMRVASLLNSIGLVSDFAPIVYVIGHGSSSVNNPHYAAYDCGACSGRPGSVNARVFCFMANHPQVRANLFKMGINIPNGTQFIGGLHDTTRDEVAFYDESSLVGKNIEVHFANEIAFKRALDYNSKERSRRFDSINSGLSPEKIHEKIKRRSVSLFEPRPELNHATNALCIVGSRELSRDLFLDRRAFLNSYDYKIDPEGKFLQNIMKPLGPVCGGINLEYFFSRVDNDKLGAGTKLPHNVMGLFGVANGIDGDLRPGLPSQMIEVHDPIRLLIIVEHFPEIVLTSIQQSDETYEWFINEWVHLVVVNPETKELYYFKEGGFTSYQPTIKAIQTIADMTPILEKEKENIPVYLLN